MLRSLDAQPLDPKDAYHQRLRNIVEEVRVATGGEAVVGHEMAHIVSGDCLMTTISSALFGLYSDILKGIEAVFGKAGEEPMETDIIAVKTRAAISLSIIYIVLYITQAMASVMKIVISRQREYRADAIAVRLTRDPLALAEALYTISRNYRRVGTGGSEGLAPIFILSPRGSAIIEEEGVWANLFYPSSSKKAS